MCICVYEKDHSLWNQTDSALILSFLIHNIGSMRKLFVGLWWLYKISCPYSFMIDPWHEMFKDRGASYFSVPWTPLAVSWSQCIPSQKSVFKMHQKYIRFKREAIILKYSYQNISKHICDIVIDVFHWYIQQQVLVTGVIAGIIVKHRWAEMINWDILHNHNYTNGYDIYRWQRHSYH